MKIDSHQHFWHYNTIDYPWINDQMNVLKRDFLPKDLFTELKQVGFDGSIAVQARQNLKETQWLLGLAEHNEFIKGVVGWVDLCSPEVVDQLEEFSANPKLVGVRHVIHDEPDDNFMDRNDFQRGIGLLKNYKLTYDLLIFAKHIPLANELVHKFPNQRFVVDHIAKPCIKDWIKTPWDREIGELAKNPNVYCKLSGMVTEANWHNWKTSDFQFYLDVVYNAFGKDRLMIGSDWPVCTLAGNYKGIISIVIDYFKKNSPENLSKIMGQNCIDFYLKNRSF